jgi:Rne/Rng family ribonuclease
MTRTPPKFDLLCHQIKHHLYLAAFENNQLESLWFQSTQPQIEVGQIYLAKVVQIKPKLQTAFLSLDGKANAYLQQKDLDANFISPQKSLRESEPKQLLSCLHEGQKILVQIIKPALGQKLPKVSTQIRLVNDAFILSMAHVNAIKTSKKLNEPDIAEIKALLEARSQSQYGWIIRTLAGQKQLDQLQAQILELEQQWQALILASTQKKLGLIADTAPIGTQWLHHYGRDEVGHYYTDASNNLSHFFAEPVTATSAPPHMLNVLHQALDSITTSHFPLPSGGSVVIESTEALIAIDVNSGDFFGEENPQQNRLKINLEAAQLIANIIKIRQLHGMVVIDFLKMPKKAHQAKVKQALETAFKNDRAQIKLGYFSLLGLFELSRQCLGMTLANFMESNVENTVK